VRRTILVLALLALGAACGGRYYRITDTSSGRVYYTRDVDEKRRTGAVDFKDSKTGAKVTLQSSQVEKIPEAEYQKGLASK
jgi:hypothetical protein